MRVVPAAPSAVLVLDDAPGRFGERPERVAPPPAGRPRTGQLAGFGQRDEPAGAEAELAAASADDDRRNAIAKLGVDESLARFECRNALRALAPTIA